MVRGVAATGSPLVGEVTLRDSSSPRRDKVVVIGNDGSFIIDVSDMRGPYVLRAIGIADGTRHVLYSFADRPGIANINPFTSAVVANAAGVDDPSTVFDRPDAATLERIASRMPDSLATLQAKVMPLLAAFDAGGRDPARNFFMADHDGLDGVFDSVRIVLSNGVLTITNAASGEVIFTGQVKDLARGWFTDNRDRLPKPRPRLPAPTGVQAVGGDGQISVSWNPVPNATSYDLFYMTRPSPYRAEDDDEEYEDEYDDCDDDDGRGAIAKWVRNVTSPHVLRGLPPDTTYYFMVRARENHRRGVPSAKVSATTTGATPAPTVPAAPTEVTATGGTRQVTVSWTAVAGATSYNLYWSDTSSVTTTNGTKMTGVPRPAIVTGLADSKTYYVIVTAVNSAGEGAASVQVAATTLPATPAPTAPAAPAGVGATGGNEQVTVTWSAVTGATSYNIYWSATPGVTKTTGTRIPAVTSPYVHTGRTASTTYYYIVTAQNSAGESGASSEASATTNPPPATVPAAPSGVQAVGGNQQVTISWNAVSGATSYNLYWSATSGVTVTNGTKIAGVSSSYVHTGRAAGTPYWYIVTAQNGVGEGPASAQVTATTNAAIDGAALYNQHCQGCHGGPIPPLSNAETPVQRRTAGDITNAINSFSQMARFRPTGTTPLTQEQIAAIAAALQ